MNRIIMILLFIIICVPEKVHANITCNDGTTSPTCQDCHQGCCSWHGGCLDSEEGSGNFSDILIITGIVGVAAYGINEARKD